MRTFLLLMLCLNLSYASQITLSDEFPRVHQMTDITVLDQKGVPVEGAIIGLTYRPNSMVERSVTLEEQTDSLGTISWIPDDAGLCSITASNARKPDSLLASTDVSVRFESFSPQGILVFLVAFVVLFGGTTLSIIMLFRP